MGRQVFWQTNYLYSLRAKTVLLIPKKYLPKASCSKHFDR
ncbi:hypothetical protein EU94_1679 [Prochlorococcus marinus str. MIT 9123]|nr:hypothetical protein EU94_1679 [Prochlorococcus marinus str. MIT 9123]